MFWKPGNIKKRFLKSRASYFLRRRCRRFSAGALRKGVPKGTIFDRRWNQNTPKWSQNGAKREPTWSQNEPGTSKMEPCGAVSVFDAKMEGDGSLIHAKTWNCRQNQRFSAFAKVLNK